jgi:hypothetical protein
MVWQFVPLWGQAFTASVSEKPFGAPVTETDGVSNPWFGTTKGVVTFTVLVPPATSVTAFPALVLVSHPYSVQ